MSNTPRTDALLERHCQEARENMPQFAANGMKGANELALRQVKELLAHARKLESTIEEHNRACTESCNARAHHGDCPYRREDGGMIYGENRRCPDCPTDWLIVDL